MASVDSSIVALNNYLQNRGRLSAISWEDKSDGPRHEVVWTSYCKIDGKKEGEGQGNIKNLAREAAAAQALAKLIAEDAASGGGTDVATNSESAT